MIIWKRHTADPLYPLSIIMMISLVVGIWTPQPGYAEIYKYIENGVVHYTNYPPEHLAYEIFGGHSTSLAPQTRKTSKKSPQSQRLPHITIIYKVANAYHMNPELVKAIIKVESNYNHRAVSPKGAQGLMQLMPATARRFGVNDVFDPEENITGGVKFLRYLFNEFGEHNLDLVLAGYNAGEEVVRKYGNKVPPYSETQHYIKHVKALYLPHLKYKSTKAKSIYRYIDKNGVLAFTNIPRVN